MALTLGLFFRLFWEFPLLFNLSCRIILETDGSIIAGKVATHTMDDSAPLSEQVILQFSMLLVSIFYEILYVAGLCSEIEWLHPFSSAKPASNMRVE